MTSFMAWLGADSRGPTSLYFASDSRISWRKDKNNWDTARKLFATQTRPEIFGFTGYALLPQVVLARACDFIDRGFRSVQGSECPQSWALWLKDIVESEAKAHPQKYLSDDFSIFYGVREGEGMPGRSNFFLFHIQWSTHLQAISMTSIDIPVISSVLQLHGSGTNSLEKWTASWKKSDQGDTSRTFFSAFCDSLSQGADELSGGEPQLIGLYRKGNAQVFGVVSENGPSLQGCLNLPIPLHSKIEWRDKLFQRVNRQGKLLKNAQIQTRPKNVGKPSSEKK